jgi:hypothetical protein
MTVFCHAHEVPGARQAHQAHRMSLGLLWLAGRAACDRSEGPCAAHVKAARSRYDIGSAAVPSATPHCHTQPLLFHHAHIRIR